jgi:Arc/MetJ-type ribon-helix-helix transcriptional regulator
MSKVKVAISLDRSLLEQVDALVQQNFFPSRSGAIEAALVEKLGKMSKRRLARESAKLDPKEERALADEGLSEDADAWPAY